MINYDIKIHNNPDAQAWAKFFIQTKEEKSWRIEDIDEPLMLAWFANAMMAVHDHIKSQRTWVGLTDETLDDVYFCVEGSATPLETWREQARTIEAKLKEKNT
tara:strand:- start:601 stop:909 length:309 start_codon:yes stop_codon:yes gene_type:complete